MAELKELLPETKTLSLLYVDTNQDFLSAITNILAKVFKNIDTATDATLGLGYLKINHYDIVVIDSISDIMDMQSFVQNIREYNKFQEIIITTSSKSTDEALKFYELNIASLQKKPFKTSEFLDTILDIALKLNSHSSSINSNVETLEEELATLKRRIGRFMMNEKSLHKQIESYKNNVHSNKNIYELTKLPSKYALQESLSGVEKSILYLNIDYFDFVNTTYGMGKANKLLKKVAINLGLFLPSNAVLYHITADEFIILLEEPSSNQAFLLSQQIQSLFKETPIEFDGHSQYIVFSIGIDHGEGNYLFVHSKSASKEARFFGGNQIVVYNPYSKYMKEQRENLHWVGVLQKAFDEDRILTYYQPIISNDNTKTKHYEVLCRLMDNNKLIDASLFIKSAKNIGLLTQITKSVIDKTFKLFKNNDYNFSINISMQDLHENYLVKFLEYKCNRYNISPSRVHLEIIEDIIINKTIELDRQISELKAEGYHVIVDDFGTDKSAYSRMFDLNAEYIKIDGTFIKSLSGDAENRIIVKSIVEFAKKSGIKTIAEHVETEEVFNIVKSLGVDYSQGYYTGKPSISLQ